MTHLKEVIVGDGFSDLGNAFQKAYVKAYKKIFDAEQVLKGNRGDFVQQALLWTLIAIAGIAALTLMGNAISEKFTQLKDTFLNTNP